YGVEHRDGGSGGVDADAAGLDLDADDVGFPGLPCFELVAAAGELGVAAPELLGDAPDGVEVVVEVGEDDHWFVLGQVREEVLERVGLGGVDDLVGAVVEDGDAAGELLYAQELGEEDARGDAAVAEFDDELVV